MPDKIDKPPTPKSGQRIAKVIARAGLTSRREAETWIAAGRVAVNGAVIASPAVNIGPRDAVTVDGKPLPRRERTRLFLFNKPRGLVTTTSDPEGRATVFGALPKNLPRLISIGRLDYNTEGLLLLTNDGGLARVLEHPQTGWLRRYRVRAHGRITQAQLDTLRDGISIEGIHYGPIEATLERPQGANVWLTFAIREGKNREVRNVLGHLGLDVNRLIRVSYGPFQLGTLADGAVEEVPTRALREQLGWKIVSIADVDFDAPLHADEPRERFRESGARASREPPRTAETRGHRGRDSEARSPRRGDTEARTSRPSRDAGERAPRPSRDDPRKAPRAPQDQGAPPRGHRPWRGRGRERPVADIKLTKDTPRKTTAGLLTDRKGRRVLVQRTRSEAPPEESRRPPREHEQRGSGRDRRHGPRPSRPRPPRDKR